MYFALQFLRLRNNSAWWKKIGTTGNRVYVEVLVLHLATAARQPSRVMVILRSAAMRSASGGCVLKRLENIPRAVSGCTIISAEVVGEMSMGIRLL